MRTAFCITIFGLLFPIVVLGAVYCLLSYVMWQWIDPEWFWWRLWYLVIAALTLSALVSEEVERG